MKLADVENATIEELRVRIDELFEDAENAQWVHQQESFLSEARFYLGELDRRRYEEDREEDGDLPQPQRASCELRGTRRSRAT